MSDKPDWDSAPEEATHWTPETSECLPSWWKEEPDGWYSKNTINDTPNWFYEERDKPYNVEGYQVRPSKWPSERERLQNKPKWDEAPEWAEWLAQDYDGLWVFYEHPVETYHNEWLEQDGFDGKIGRREKGEVLGDWRDTLESRPESIMPPTHENMRCIVRPIERKEWNGPEYGLPPVGWHGEIRHSGHRCWHECFVMPDNAVVIKPLLSEWSESVACSIRDTDQFRPIRTEEDKAVEEMLVVTGCSGSDYAMRALYAAGYRKQEEPK
jgi:hypothetical protein